MTRNIWGPFHRRLPADPNATRIVGTWVMLPSNCSSQRTREFLLPSGPNHNPHHIKAQLASSCYRSAEIKALIRLRLVPTSNCSSIGPILIRLARKNSIRIVSNNNRRIGFNRRRKHWLLCLYLRVTTCRKILILLLESICYITNNPHKSTLHQ